MPSQTQKQTPNNKHKPKNTKKWLTLRENRYSRLVFFIALGFLLIVPLLWLVKLPRVQEIIPILRSEMMRIASPNKLGIAPSPVKPRDVPDYMAQLVYQSHDNIHIKSGERVRVRLQYKNVGRKTWEREGTHDFIALNVKDPIGRHGLFEAADWDIDYNRYHYRPGRMSDRVVKPGYIATFYITLHAPQKTGDYTENFGLVSEWREWIQGGGFSIPIKVSPIEAPYLDEKHRGESINVGIWNTDEKVQISSTGPFKVRDAQGTVLKDFEQAQVVTAAFEEGVYYLDGPNGEDSRGWKYKSKSYVTFEPAPHEFIEIVNYEARPRWNPSLNDNYFRGRLQYRHSDITNKTWVINVLQMEAYVRGVAESGNSSPKEFLQTLVIAERTYAEYHRRANRRYKDDYFHVDNLYSQVYRGAGYELRASNVVQAIHDTTGQIVTYEDKLAITPYFSHSDGKTRAFHDVWGGDLKPWLVSVEVPWSKEYDECLGHCVGMDASAAIKMAQEGWKYDRILRYFYKDTRIKQIY